MRIKNIKDKFNNQFAGSLIYLLSVNALFLIFFSIFRIINIITNWPTISIIDDPALYNYIFKAITKGIRFDNIVTSYVIIIPLIILPIAALFNYFNKKLIIAANIYFSLCAFVLLGLSMANIPYFEYFNQYIPLSALYWFEYSDQIIGMLTGEKIYLYYFLLFIFIFLVFIFSLIIIRRLITKHIGQRVKVYKNYYVYIPILLLFYLLCLWGTRGWLFTRKLREPDTIFCQHLIICQMVMNPVYYIAGTQYSSQLHTLVDDNEYGNVIKRELGFDIFDEKYYINNHSTDSLDHKNKPNIIFIFIESFSHEYIERNQGEKPLFPFIKGLINKSLYFDNFYSHGIHTNQGITASLYGIPSVFEKVMTIKAPIQLDLGMFGEEKYNDIRKKSPYLHGLPNNLKELDYTNLFFVTHTINFDNLNNFLPPLNGFDLIYGSENYPESENVNTWGVSDKYLFDYSKNVIDSVAGQNKPFLASILTISNHPPYVYPKEFKNVSNNEDDSAMAYADNCLKEFMEGGASKEEWYNNTIFVFLGDHGKRFNQEESLPLSFFHVPLIIYSPLFENAPQRYSFPMGQIDLYPTDGTYGTSCTLQYFWYRCL